MHIITISHPEQLNFLVHLFKVHLGTGQLSPDQLGLAADTYDRVLNAKEIPTDLGKVTVEEFGPSGVVLNIDDPRLENTPD